MSETHSQTPQREAVKKVEKRVGLRRGSRQDYSLVCCSRQMSPAERWNV